MRLNKLAKHWIRCDNDEVRDLITAEWKAIKDQCKNFDEFKPYTKFTTHAFYVIGSYIFSMGYRAAKKECGRTLILALLGKTNGEMNRTLARAMDLKSRELALERLLDEVDNGKQYCDN